MHVASLELCKELDKLYYVMRDNMVISVTPIDELRERIEQP